MKLLISISRAVCISAILVAPLHAADAEVMQRLERIERLLQSQGLLDMLQQIEAAQRELSTLQGEIEFQNHTLEQLKKRQRDLYTDIDQRLQNLERGSLADSTTADTDLLMIDNADDDVPLLQTLEPIGSDMDAIAARQQPENSLVVEVVESESAPTPTEALPAQKPVDVSLAASNADEGLSLNPEAGVELDPLQIRAQYQQAFKLLKQSQYEQAIKAFREFLLMNPQSEYSDNAQYWLGEAHYVTRQFEPALLEYNKLLENYPDSQKLTHSLLKIGFCYHELGQLEQARVQLQSLVQKYPGTTAARLAEERLKKMAQNPEQKVQAVETEVSN